jgi:Domain of unknown function (DUF4145)
MEEKIFIDCPHCSERVEASLLRPWLDHQYEYRLGFVWCGRCENLLIAYQDFLGPIGKSGAEEYSEAQRVWPSPEVTLSLRIPDVIRLSLVEARKCLSCGTHTASVAMTGRGIEGLCHHFKTKRKDLFEGLKELLDREIIDKRLYGWADALRRHRNLAAHASSASFSRGCARHLRFCRCDLRLRFCAEPQIRTVHTTH